MNEALQTWCASEIDSVMEEKGGTLTVTPLKVEASHRHFYRLGNLVADRNLTYVCMHSPPELENNDQFTALAKLFRSHGLAVAEILAADETRGFFLLDDLGPLQLADVYGTDLMQPALNAAIASLHVLQDIHDPSIAAYDKDRFAMELGLFNEWFLSLIKADTKPDPYQDVYEALIAQTQTQPQVCIHRDFHCRNLLYNNARLGIVDFQDALVGPALYDVASLLRDCYHEFAEADVDAWLAIYLASSPLQIAQPDAKRWLDLTAIQRQLKAIGIFSRLHLRDGKSSHLGHIEPLLRRIINLADRYPETRPLCLRLHRLLKPTAQMMARLL
jgi:aminoglycoside/choline kinase family phosphotransferase